MRTTIIIIISLLISATNDSTAQDQNVRVDSLVNLLKTAGREWNDYAKPLINIGDEAVPKLVEVVRDKRLDQWNRRIAAMTLNDIHSPLWKNPALEILFDRSEDPAMRNHVTAGLKGFDLSDVKDDLYGLFQETDNNFYQLNLANLMITADTSLAFECFRQLYMNFDGYVQKSALLNLIRLHPEESEAWLTDALQIDDWETANLAMDSLISSRYSVTDELVRLFSDSGIEEEVKWRIVYVLGHRNEPESFPLLLSAFRDDSWLVHTEAALSLCRFDPEMVIKEMKDLKTDPREYVRNNSRWVIRRMRALSDH